MSVTSADALNEVAQPELEKVPEESVGEEMVVAIETWQRLLALEMDLAVYLRSIAEPNQLPDLDS